MFRTTFLGLAAVLLQPAFAATPTVYAEAPYAIFSRTSATTFKSSVFVGDLPGATNLALSPAGKAFDTATGKTLHSYQTKYPIPQTGQPFAVVPNNSELYVATCANYAGPGTSCYAGYVEVFSVATGRRIAALSFGSDQVLGLAASPDSSTV